MEGKDTSEYSIIIAAANFGCGSSREHAPFALQKAGVQVVIAESYARIFYRNAVDGGFLIPLECGENLVNKVRTGDLLTVNLEQNTVSIEGSGEVFGLSAVGDVLPIIEAGGLFEYARQSGMI